MDPSRAKQIKGTKAVNGGISSRSHARGSIIRLRLHNFLTFDGVEIHPSAQLNVIVGPNGTGKSSVVCAICIGLGGSTKLLGRARDIKDFVKHGKREGFVELELCETRRGARNPVIKRRLTADDNSSIWYINGRVSKLTDVTKLVEEMNIQLQNKCVFLPQDMVVEFARMDMHQRLEETEQAIGPRGMFDTHTELKGLRSTYSTAVTELKQKKIRLDGEERKNQLLERDVERFRNRQEYMARIKWIKLKKLWLEYEEARNNLNSKKSDRKEAIGKLKALKQKYQPIKDKLKAQEDAVKIFKETEQKINHSLRQARSKVTALQEKLTSLEDKLEEPRQELEQSKKDEQERRKKVETLRREIEGFKQELTTLESQESIVQKIHAKNAEIGTLEQEITDIGYQLREMCHERERYNDIIRRNEDEIRKMKDVRSQRLQMLQGRDRPTYDALMWLSQNQHAFKKPVLEPVMVSVNILDPRYTSQVEAFLGGRDFLSFVAQSEEDKEMFLREVRDKMRLKVNVVRAPDRRLQDFKPRVPIDVLKRYGFEKVMIDLIDAPEPLLCYFCQYQRLHEVPIAGDLPASQIQRITDSLPDLRLFFANSSRYSVTYSRYRKATSTRISELGQPKFLVASVDTTRKVSLEQEIQETFQCRKELDHNYSVLKTRDDALRLENNKILQEKNALKKVTDQRRAHNSSIASREAKLANHTSSSFSLEEAEENCEQAVEKIQRDRVSCFSDIKDGLKCAVNTTAESVEASLRVCTSEMRVSFLVQQYQDIKSTYDNAEEELKTFELDLKAAKEKAQILLQSARSRSGVSSPADNTELMEQFQSLPNDLSELLELVHGLQAQADMCDGTDHSVVEEYEQRKKEIGKLKNEIENKQTDLETRDQRIANLKESWLTPLKELISGVSDHFRHFFSSHTQMEAAGEVCLVENEDFSKYGVEIKVKFRDDEQLQALNAQRQSGGERSVSTMLYLMALQGNTSCPFRVVDEINQGMDPVNERHVFNLIVKAASEGAQYFLLSPKLLQNLEYSEAVQVHIVNNGQEVMPYREWNLEKILG